MKKITPHLLPALLGGVCMLLTFSGCWKSNSTDLKHYTLYRPTYSSKADVLAHINGNPSRPLDSAGKIYIYGPYILISEPETGIHIIDNSTSVPKQIAFLSIPGNQDIAVKGNTLYADMYTDLLAIDISNPRQARITGKIEGLFRTRVGVKGYYSNQGDQVISGWSKKDTLISKNDAAPWYAVCDNCPLDFPLAALASSSSKGIAGSMAKMVLANERLYAISDFSTLGVIDTREAATPSLNAQIYAGMSLETIFPFGDKLFLGSSIGTYIYDVSNADQPVQMGTFQHSRSCDPVITDGRYAYVTLHSGSWCGAAANELNVVDVRDLNHPVLVKTYQMTRPMGLSKDGNLLFVCDGDQGVKVFDASDPSRLPQINQAGSGSAYDVIAANKRLLITSNKGIYQYSYANGKDLRFLSLLPLKK